MRQGKQSTRYTIGLLFIIFVVLIPFIRPFNQYFSIPNELITFDHQFELPKINSTVQMSVSSLSKNEIEITNLSGEQSVIYNVNGLPIKKVNLSILDDIHVIPGGQSIGIKLQTLGVLVVGHHLIKKDEEYISPGEQADIDVGDIILKINETDIKKMEDVSSLINRFAKNDEPLNITIKRGEEEIVRTVKPLYDSKEKQYRIGLYIRDSTSGIGTMTFYEPKSKKYGALGHVISDVDTHKPIEIYEGTIMRSTVNSITKGKNGRPGEKKANFSRDEQKLGTITKNTPFGIFGELNQFDDDFFDNEPVPIALAHEIEEGPAKIYTVIEGDEVEAFDIEIISSSPQKIPSTKGMIIKITDERLLDKTGGIVQGMSGSPIVQNGKLIGAVTHVFVNEPHSGYGIHIEWMLQEAGIDVFNLNAKAS